MAQLEDIRKYWQKACEFDCIDSGSTCAVFSKENPFAETYSRLMAYYLRCIREKLADDNLVAEFESIARLAEIRKTKLVRVIPRERVARKPYVIEIDFTTRSKRK